MTYEAFVKEYTRLFNLAMSYSLKEVGSRIMTDKMADLADAYPEHMDRLDNEEPA